MVEHLYIKRGGCRQFRFGCLGSVVVYIRRNINNCSSFLWGSRCLLLCSGTGVITRTVTGEIVNEKDG